MYTKLKLKGDPKNNNDAKGESSNREVAEYKSSQRKSSVLFLKNVSSSIREYRDMKNKWNTKSSDNGPKYKNVVINRQYYISTMSALGIFKLNIIIHHYIPAASQPQYETRRIADTATILHIVQAQT